MSKRFRFVARLGLILGLLALPILACGPDFPNLLLIGGRRSVLTAPSARFQAEIERQQPPVAAFPHRQATNGYAAQTADAESADLRAALKVLNLPDVEVNPVVERHERERAKIKTFTEKRDELALAPTGLVAVVPELPEVLRGQVPRLPRPPLYLQGVLRRPPAPMLLPSAELTK